MIPYAKGLVQTCPMPGFRNRKRDDDHWNTQAVCNYSPFGLLAQRNQNITPEEFCKQAGRQKTV